MLYVSLGTVPVFNRPEVFEILLRAVADLDADVVVTVGRNNDPSAFEVPSNVRIERWLPLGALLPRCSAVLCHAGAGTTLAALTHRLPLVLLPPDRLTEDSVRQATLRLLTDSSYQQAAARLGDEIAAMPTADEVARGLTEASGETLRL